MANKRRKQFSLFILALGGRSVASLKDQMRQFAVLIKPRD